MPLVEELLFRGYLLARIDRGGPALRVLAIVVSSALFAAMHDRWLVALLAGVVFASSISVAAGSPTPSPRMSPPTSSSPSGPSPPAEAGAPARGAPLASGRGGREIESGTRPRYTGAFDSRAMAGSAKG